MQVVILGPPSSGKSAITIQFVQGVFVEVYDPTIEDSYQKGNLEILDTAGTEQFTAMRELYIKNGDAFVIVFSLNDKSTFNEVEEFLKEIQRVKKANMCLVGNKCDLPRTVSKEKAEKLAKEYSCDYIEASAKERINIDAIFALVQKKKQKSACVIL